MLSGSRLKRTERRKTLSIWIVIAFVIMGLFCAAPAVADEYDDLCETLDQNVPESHSVASLQATIDVKLDTIFMCAKNLGAEHLKQLPALKKTSPESKYWKGRIPRDYATDGVLRRLIQTVEPDDAVNDSVKIQLIHAKKNDNPWIIAKSSYNLSLIHISEPTRPY